jgi:hypothetical protein
MSALLKAAYLCIDATEYEKAIGLLERVAIYNASVPVTRFKCNILFKEAAVCRLILGVSN